MTYIPDAIELLKTGGWCKQNLRLDTKHCMRGALKDTAYITPKFNTQTKSYNLSLDYQLCAEVIREQYPERIDYSDNTVATIELFNDHPETEFEDVLTVLEKAVIKGEEKYD